MNEKKKMKTFVQSLLVAVVLLLTVNLSVQAQDRPGGLFGDFGDQTPVDSKGLMNRGDLFACLDITGQGFGATNGAITGQTFGDNAPLGSGLFVLLAASAGYASIKSRKKQNKQNRKEN